MVGPIYNSRATKIAVVVQGEGYFEMACPHLASKFTSSHETRIGSSYQKVRSKLRRGMVLVIPPGHPFVGVTSTNQNLQIVGFNVNTRDNEIVPLAGDFMHKNLTRWVTVTNISYLIYLRGDK